MKRRTGWLAGILCVPVIVLGEVDVQSTRIYTSPRLGLTVAAGIVPLPAGESWRVEEPEAGSGLRHVQFVLSPAEQRALQGERFKEAEKQRQLEQERAPLWQLQYACEEYARTNQAVGPAAWADLERTNSRGRALFDISGLKTNFVLVPAVPMPRGKPIPPSAREPLAMQLHPLLPDGKHWVLFNNGQSERVTVDVALCARLGVVIQPVVVPESAPKAAPGFSTWWIMGLIQPDVPAKPVRLTLVNRKDDSRQAVEWNLASASPGDEAMLAEWARTRAIPWITLAAGGDAPVLRQWLSRGRDLYGASLPDMRMIDPGRGGERTDAFSVFGGRAAVRETLQMQLMRGGAETSTNNREILVKDLAAVAVKSHPFAEMLAREPRVPELPLARHAPADRVFLYFPKPASLVPLLNEGADFLYQGGSLASANPAAYNLKARYLARFAVSEKWVRDVVLQSGLVTEMAILLPDLFLIDGTDLTILARIPSAALLKPVLGAVGVAGLSGDIVEKTGKAGSSYWAMQGDILVFGTSRAEVERVLALGPSNGAGSLGEGAEFRYMLTRMPVGGETRAFCYLSDPFIRRLVGPEVKIGQLRRQLAKGAMESAEAAAMLWKLDGQPGTPDLPGLVAKGYLAASPAGELALDDQGICRSREFGTPGRLKTLLETPVDRVTRGEADAYKSYMENYSRFWRQYFDPIAFRLDEGPGGELKLNTFILPLIDNSIYNGLKSVVMHKESGKPLRVPDLNPAPLMLVSMNLSEESWTHVTREIFSEMLRRYTTLNPVIFDKIGPGVHLAVHDADPILTFGSGDAMGILGAPLTGGFRGGEMVAIPLVASLLTRPCQLMVELQEPDQVRRMMRAAANPAIDDRGRREFMTKFVKLEGRDAWICTLSVAEIVRIRFGVEIAGNYLILNNLPWSQKPGVGEAKAAPLNTLALAVRPEAGVLQAPGLFTAAAEQAGAAAAQGERYLYPFLACGAGSVPEAVRQCENRFGFAPEHPGKGEWVWKDGDLKSTLYGSLRNPVQPEFKPGAEFGVLNGIEQLNLNMQFEDAGLRVITSWKTR